METLIYRDSENESYRRHQRKIAEALYKGNGREVEREKERQTMRIEERQIEKTKGT